MRYPGIERTPAGYRIRVTAKDPRTGARREADRVVACTLDEALGLRLAWKAAIEAGGENAPQALTLEAYATSWLARRAPHLAGTTLDRYREAIDRHVLPGRPSSTSPALGAYLVSALRKPDVELWMLAGLHAGYAAETVNGWWRGLKAMLREAVVDLELPRDPTMGVRPLPVPAADLAEPNALTPGELAAFLAHTPAGWYPLVKLGFCIGARPGELRPLRWDVDYQADTGNLVLRRSQVGRHIGATKTKVPRAVLLPDELRSMLVEHRRSLVGAANPMGLLFPSPSGGYLGRTAMDRPFDSIAKAAGITKAISPRAMRRTFNDLARLAQVHDLVTRSITGHETEAMQERYSTVGNEEQRAAVGTVLRLISDSST